MKFRHDSWPHRAGLTKWKPGLLIMEGGRPQLAFLSEHCVKCLAPIGHVFKKDTDAGGLVVNMPWRRTHVASVEPGSVFRLVCSSRMVETATVLDRFEDFDGITHVRYQLKLGTPNSQSISEDMRVLALSAFSQRYDSSHSDLSAA